MKRIVILTTLMLTLVGCGLKTKTLPEFYKKDLNDVTKIVIVSGENGYKKTTTDLAVIEKFIEEIKDIKFIPEKNQEDRVGWRYSITFFQNDKETFQFGLTQVDDHYYYTEPDLYPVVDDFYKSMDDSN